MTRPDIDSIDTVEGLNRWYADADSAIAPHVKDWPACWGGQMRFNDGGMYVDMDVVTDVLPSSREIDLYYCMCANSERPEAYPASDILAHIADGEWLSSTANEYIENGGAVFYTECYAPSDEFSHRELVELVDERPDLFTEDDMLTFPELALAKRDAVGSVAIGGEPTWYCPEDGPIQGLSTQSQLEAFFAAEPGLEEDRSLGTTFSDWIYDQERVGNLVPLFGLKRGDLARDAVDGLAVDVVVGPPWYDEACSAWRQVVADQDGRLYSPLCENLRSAKGEDRAPSQLANRAKKASEGYLKPDPALQPSLSGNDLKGRGPRA